MSIHRPLGIAILALVAVRFVNRLLNPPPPLPATVGRMERVAAMTSEYVMYGLMFILPLVGWGMLSAARYLVVLFGSGTVAIYPAPGCLCFTRPCGRAYTVPAYLFFLTFLAHFSAILFHTLIVRDGMLLRMAPWNVSAEGGCVCFDHQKGYIDFWLKFIGVKQVQTLVVEGTTWPGKEKREQSIARGLEEARRLAADF